jgi:hypothetical protein
MVVVICGWCFDEGTEVVVMAFKVPVAMFVGETAEIHGSPTYPPTKSSFQVQI